MSRSKTDWLSIAAWRQRLQARFARSQQLWLQEDGQVRRLDEGTVEPWQDWLAGHAGSAIELIVPAALQHQLVCETGLPLNDEPAVAAYARQQFGHYFGAAAQRWAIAPWRSGERSGAVALQGVDAEALQASSHAARVELRAIRPAWSAALPALVAEHEDWMQAERAALAWVEGPLLVWARFEQGQCVELRHLRLREATVEALAQALDMLPLSENRVLLAGFGVAGDASALRGVQLHGRIDSSRAEAALFEAAPARQSRLPSPDFLSARPRPSPLAWPVAVTGALVLATAAMSAFESHQAMQKAGEHLAQLQQKPQPRRSASTANAGKTTRQAEPDQRSLREAQALLAKDWQASLIALERSGAQAQVQWLALDLQAGRGELRLEGLAADKAMALQAAELLSRQGLWSELLLARLQADAAGGGQRFELAGKGGAR
ncbi:hypothetical protein [Pelomonas sp. SE-A7]|uniref:hypothetical protein n=1 Tax=Pelomonas sp. SE-A7 TaxID=3054953 RepID=UPI00259CF585|nr:hypothetical protein [Pelomonas sp. SE-A7]MDM4767021.1 hypothetical protein [Pelomonas sp. SE-A7]